VATALIRPLAWEPPHASGAAQEMAKRQKKKKKKTKKQQQQKTKATTTPDPSCNLHHSSRQCQILNPLSEARDRT